MVSEFGKFICFSASSQRIDLSLGLHFNDENLDWDAARCFTCDTFFGISVFEMGFPLLGFFMNLVLTGWAISQFVTGILIRYGLGAESLTWVLPFLIAPFSCIYYPLATLPDWMQSVAVFIPTTYVFEGMRSLLLEDVFRSDLMVKGFVLNIAYLITGIFVFFLSFQAARRHGLLLQTGE